MKKITNYFKTLALLIAMSFTGASNAQCVISAGFSYTVGNNGAVSFESTSTGTVFGTTYVWDFGNGFNNFGNGGSGYHSFPLNGNYTVGLIASNATVTPGCMDTVYQVISVNTVTCTINAMFVNSQGASGLVNFNNLTYGADPGVSYLWDFGDGSTGTSASPAHTFSANGMYVVSLTADNNYTYTCNSSYTTSIFVNSYCTYTPSFTATYGLNGIVTLSSTTSSFLFDTWDFGDGTPPLWPIAGGIMPQVHTYQNGNYVVSLTVTNNTFAPSCSLTYTQAINVTSYMCNLNANFSHAAVTSPTAANAVSFDASSTTGVNGNTQYFWDFGDGNTYGPNNFTYVAWHVYSSSGPYNVKLKVWDMTNPTCVDSIIMPVTATGTCVADASFILYPSGTPQQWIVSPNYPYNVTAASWNWGDGSTGNILYDSHTYSAAGTYTLCLTVTVTCGAVDTECSSYYVYKTGETNEMIGVTVIEPGTTTGIKNISVKDAVFTVYPNPGNGLINISSNNTGSAKIIICDLLGHVIYNDSADLSNTTSKQIQLTDVSNGIYFIKVISGDKTHTQKIVLSK